MYKKIHFSLMILAVIFISSCGLSQELHKFNANTVAVFEQVGDFPSGYYPEIKLYDNGYFEFKVNCAEGMYTHYGHYLYGSGETGKGDKYHYFNCYVDNCDWVDGLSFRLSFQDDIIKYSENYFVTFATNFSYTEFGMTATGDIFDIEIKDSVKLFKDRGETYYSECVSEDLDGFEQEYIIPGKIFLDGDIRNDIEYFLVSEQITYKQECCREGTDYANALNNASYFYGNQQVFQGTVTFCGETELLLKTEDGTVAVTFPEEHNPGIMVNDKIIAYGTLWGLTTYSTNVDGMIRERDYPLLISSYIDGKYNEDAFLASRFDIGAEILELQGTWYESNIFWMGYTPDDFMIWDNTTLTDDVSYPATESYIIQSAERKRSSYGAEYLEISCKVIDKRGREVIFNIDYHYMTGKMYFKGNNGSYLFYVKESDEVN